MNNVFNKWWVMCFRLATTLDHFSLRETRVSQSVGINISCLWVGANLTTRFPLLVDGKMPNLVLWEADVCLPAT